MNIVNTRAPRKRQVQMRGQVAYERAAFFSFEGLLHSRIFLISQHVRPTAFSESFDIIIATCEDPIVDARRGGGGVRCWRMRSIEKAAKEKMFMPLKFRCGAIHRKPRRAQLERSHRIGCARTCASHRFEPRVATSHHDAWRWSWPSPTAPRATLELQRSHRPALLSSLRVKRMSGANRPAKRRSWSALEHRATSQTQLHHPCSCRSDPTYPAPGDSSRICGGRPERKRRLAQSSASPRFSRGTRRYR
jgi:hypothetical protein